MADNLPAAGWYPDSKDSMRWWDGSQWTEQRQEVTSPQDSTAAEEPTAADSFTGAMPAPPSAPPASRNQAPRSDKPQFYKRRWFVGVVAAVIGIGLGAASVGGSNVEDNPKFKDMQSNISAVKADLKDANAEIATISDREAKVKEREDAVADAEAQVKDEAADVASREKAVGITERKVKANTVSGDGIYKVGDDIKAGTYKTKGAPGCYYAILASTDTSNIVDNNNLDGPGFLTVRDGQYLELSGCDDWVRQ